MRIVASYLARGLLVACLGSAIAGCSNTGQVPSNIAGTWEFLLTNNGCPEFVGVFNANDNLGIEVFTVSQTGQNVAASFVDNGGNNCSLTGSYSGDQFIGRLEVAEPSSGGRVVRADVQAFARQFGINRQVDGWARISFDTEEQCIGDIIEFCAKVRGEGDVTPDPDPDPDPEPEFLCGPVEIVFLVQNDAALTDVANSLCNELRSAILADLAANRVESVDITTLGITVGGPVVTAGNGAFSCLDDNVVNRYGTRLPPDGVETINDELDWGPAVTVLADRYAWLNGRFRIIIPVVSSGPDNGGIVCDADDEAAISTAGSVASGRQVVVSPVVIPLDLAGTTISCAQEAANDIALATGGVSQFVPDTTQAVEAVRSIVFDACSGRNPPPNITPNPEPAPPEMTDEFFITQCPAVDLVFLVDTSGSMIDDILILCGGDLNTQVQFDPPLSLPPLTGALPGVQARLNAISDDVDVRVHILGITEDGSTARSRLTSEAGQLSLPPPPATAFDCILDGDTVPDLVGIDVPIDAGTTGPILFANPITDGSQFNHHVYESWASAAAIVAAGGANAGIWRPGALRIVVVVSDEGPEKGNGPDAGQDGGCNDADFQAVQNAIRVANANNTVVSGLAAFIISDVVPSPGGFHPCVTADDGSGEMDKLAAGTGGIVQKSLDLSTQINLLLAGGVQQFIANIQELTQPLEDAVFEIILDACKKEVLKPKD